MLKYAKIYFKKNHIQSHIFCVQYYDTPYSIVNQNKYDVNS